MGTLQAVSGPVPFAGTSKRAVAPRLAAGPSIVAREKTEKEREHLLAVDMESLKSDFDITSAAHGHVWGFFGFIVLGAIAASFVLYLNLPDMAAWIVLVMFVCFGFGTLALGLADTVARAHAQTVVRIRENNIQLLKRLLGVKGEK